MPLLGLKVPFCDRGQWSNAAFRQIAYGSIVRKYLSLDRGGEKKHVHDLIKACFLNVDPGADFPWMRNLFLIDEFINMVG